jgi:adenosine deaminase
VELRLNSLRAHGEALRRFLEEMPKGADLHSHLSGAVTTERLIEWGAADGLCVDTSTFTATPPPCAQGAVPIAGALSDPVLYEDILGAWSMEGFQGNLLEAHQHFFDTFGKFGAVLTDARTDDAIADVLSIAARNHQLYVELMQGLNSSLVGGIASKYIMPGDPWDEGYLLEKRAQIMTDPVFGSTLAQTHRTIEDSINGARRLLGCATNKPDPGCDVGVRFILSANRTRDRGYVFAQWVFGYELAQISPHVVGVELVSPEENSNSLLYYDDEMSSLDVLRRFNLDDPSRRPVHIALHAGELIPEVLPPTPEGQRHLTFHIRHAVGLAHAERIGHGSDLFDEDEPLDLLREMRDGGVMVEICLTSNATLLGKVGRTHPVRAYVEHDVPAALATDDEGVLRIDILDEFVRAVTLQKLRYRTLKKMVRASLEHSFLPGASVWSVSGRHVEVTDACAHDALGDPYPSVACERLLADSERAAMQWKLEAQLAAFEEAVLRGPDIAAEDDLAQDPASPPASPLGQAY